MTDTADAAVSISQAKSMIRNLYYGQQQASQRGIDAEMNYITSHIYPGMYSNSRQCLSNIANELGFLYGPGSPNLLTLDFDKSWRIPTGLPLNKLSGAKPQGDTFVLDVTWRNGVATNHVTIRKGKAYYFLWVCGA